MNKILKAIQSFFGRALTPAPRTPNRDFAWVPVYIFGSVYYTISLFIERMGALNWVLHAALAVICVRLAGVTLANGIRTLLDELYDDLTEGDEEIFVIMASRAAARKANSDATAALNAYSKAKNAEVR